MSSPISDIPVLIQEGSPRRGPTSRREGGAPTRLSGSRGRSALPPPFPLNHHHPRPKSCLRLPLSTRLLSRSPILRNGWLAPKTRPSLPVRLLDPSLVRSIPPACLHTPIPSSSSDTVPLPVLKLMPVIYFLRLCQWYSALFAPLLFPFPRLSPLSTRSDTIRRRHPAVWEVAAPKRTIVFIHGLVRAFGGLMLDWLTHSRPSLKATTNT